MIERSRWRLRAAALGLGLLLSLPVLALEISLVTIGPGEIYWSRFGHNAILVEDQGQARLYNFGMFDFEQENFLLNFIRGRMTYMVAATPPSVEFDYYRDVNRSVRIQRLNLSPRQSRTLADYLAWHHTPPNDTYLYDYYYNNCSTKVRDSLDRALDGQLMALFATRPARFGTFRDHTNRLTRPDLPLYIGTQVGLGRMVDHRISRWDEFFIPMELADAVQRAQVRWEDGSLHPLVASDRELAISNPIPEPDRAPQWWTWFLLAGLALSALLIVADRGDRPWLTSLWWLVSGLAGLALLGLWSLTDHQSAWYNENLLLLSPLGLVAAVAALARWRGPVRTVSWLILAGAAIAIALKFVLDPVQGNWEILAFCLPVQVTALIVAYRL